MTCSSEPTREGASSLARAGPGESPRGFFLWYVPPMEALDDETLAALAGYLARVKHDLGKYVAFQLRWLPEGASLDDRRQALVADLAATRRGPEGTLDAATLWESLRPALVGEAPLPNGARVDLTGDARLTRIEAGMAVVREVLPSLRDGSADAPAVARGSAAALEVAEACRDWARDVRRR